RPMMRSTNSVLIAHNSEPTIMTVNAMIDISRLPYISAILATMSVETAEVSRAAVTSHEACALDTSSRAGRSGSSGMVSVNCIATTSWHDAMIVWTTHNGTLRMRSGTTFISKAVARLRI